MSVADDLMELADTIREDIKKARADGDNERRSFFRGELRGVLQAYDLVITEEVA